MRNANVIEQTEFQGLLGMLISCKESVALASRPLVRIISEIYNVVCADFLTKHTDQQLGNLSKSLYTQTTQREYHINTPSSFPDFGSIIRETQGLHSKYILFQFKTEVRY